MTRLTVGRPAMAWLGSVVSAWVGWGVGGVADGAEPVRARAGEQDVWVLREAFSGDMGDLTAQDGRVLSAKELPFAFRGHCVLSSPSLLVAIDAGEGTACLYARRGERLTKIGLLRPGPGRAITRSKILRGDGKQGLGVACYPDAKTRQFTVYLSEEGILSFEPGRVTGLTVADVRLRYGMIPSYVGTDLVYDPRRYADRDRLYVPSMNWLVGLAEGQDGMMVGVWPPGRQLVGFELGERGESRAIEGISIDLAGQPFYLSYLHHPGLWHVEPLQRSFLETNTAIEWKRPFGARWIGRFFIRSDGIHYPFYFRDESKKLWGRYIRGWFHYPTWFAGEETCLHFEKKFPPQGEALIYYLEREEEADGPSSPVRVMQQVLGVELSGRLLDVEGIAHRPLLAHGEAVCAMTARLKKVFGAGRERKEAKQVRQTADDIATFIRLIRERVFEFEVFARETNAFLTLQMRAHPELMVGQPDVRSLRPIVATLGEMVAEIQRDVPRVTLPETRAWTEDMKGLSRRVRRTNGQKYEKLAEKCRSVAGSQDDLARELSVLTIKVMEAAADMGVSSPVQVRLAEEVIGRSRRVLRRPTWWEPQRIGAPKRNPGAP